MTSPGSYTVLHSIIGGSRIHKYDKHFFNLTFAWHFSITFLGLKPGLEPDKAQAEPGPQLRAGLVFREAWAWWSPAQAGPGTSLLTLLPFNKILDLDKIKETSEVWRVPKHKRFYIAMVLKYHHGTRVLVNESQIQ